MTVDHDVLVNTLTGLNDVADERKTISSGEDLL